MAEKKNKPTKGSKTGKKLTSKKEIGKAQTLKPNLTLRGGYRL